MDITKNKEAHSCVLVFLFCLFILCTSSTPPCEWTRCLSVCRQMEGLFPQFNEGRLLEAYPRLPWSLICSWGVHWHCLASMEGTDPKAGWRVSWQTAFQWMGTIGELESLGPPCWDRQDKQGQDRTRDSSEGNNAFYYFSIFINCGGAPSSDQTSSSGNRRYSWTKVNSPLRDKITEITNCVKVQISQITNTYL